MLGCARSHTADICSTLGYPIKGIYIKPSYTVVSPIVQLLLEPIEFNLSNGVIENLFTSRTSPKCCKSRYKRNSDYIIDAYTNLQQSLHCRIVIVVITGVMKNAVHVCLRGPTYFIWNERVYLEKSLVDVNPIM